MQIEQIATAELIPYARNSRTHSAEQVAQIAASIREFGFTNPVLIDAENGIIAGHGRVLAANQIDMPAVPCIRLLHLTEAQKRAYVIADNKLALNAEWDEAMLQMEIADLQALEFDLDLIGFDDKELEEMLALNDATENGLTDEDSVPEVPDVPVSKHGDVWLLGKHRIVCGDSTEPETLSKLMRSDVATMMFTDPPWNVAIGKDTNPRHRQREGLQNDDLSAADFTKFLDGFIKAAKPYITGDIYCVMGPSEWPTLHSVLTANNLHWSSTLIWVKQQFVLGLKKYHTRYEPIWYGWSRAGKSSFNNRRDLDDVWEIPRPTRSDEHPTMKPVALPQHAIEESSRPGGIILEPFLGGGSTLLACEIAGRVCRGVEISPGYVDVVVRRWQEFTGQRATLESTGEPFPE